MCGFASGRDGGSRFSRVPERVRGVHRYAAVRPIREAWILAVRPWGIGPVLHPLDDVGGMPHVLRTACSLARAGVERVVLVWPGEPPSLDTVRDDPRLGAGDLIVTATPPAGLPDDDLLVVAGDRVFDPDLPKAIASITCDADLVTMRVAGQDLGVWRCTRHVARALVTAAADQRLDEALADACAVGGTVVAPAPRDTFSLKVLGLSSRVRAERRLLESLRRPNDGPIARWLNRRVSLAVTRRLARTNVHPAHLVLIGIALVLASAAAAIAVGGWVAPLLALLLLEGGAIAAAVAGELARLGHRTLTWRPPAWRLPDFLDRARA